MSLSSNRKKMSDPLRQRQNICKERPSIIRDDYQYYVSVLAIFKNESMNIKLWIDHYLWMGIDHLFLIDNGSDDDSLTILQPYIETGIVTVFYMPQKWQQTESYRHVYENYIKGKSRWVVIADLDEFWYVKGSTIRNELPKYEDHDVIISKWRMFGTDGHVQHPKDIRTAITHRKEELWKDGKYIFQSGKIKTGQVWIHYPVNYFGKIFNGSDIFCLNHYPLQSEEFFRKVKMTRGSANASKHEHIRNEDYFRRYNENTDFSDTDLKEMVETPRFTII